MQTVSRGNGLMGVLVAGAMFAPLVPVQPSLTQEVAAGDTLTEEGAVGAICHEPPCLASRIRAKREGESKRGKNVQSMDPSRATSAAVRPSPMSA